MAGNALLCIMTEIMIEGGAARYERPRGHGLRISEYSIGRSTLEETNEDATHINESKGLVILVDGEGIGKYGWQAKNTVLASLTSNLEAIRTEDPQSVSDTLQESFWAADKQVKAEVPKGKASATAVKIIEADDKRTALIGSVGLTRAYLLHQGELELVTRDHGVPIVAKHEEEVIYALDTIATQEQLRDFSRRKFGMFNGYYFWKNRHQASREIGGNMPVQVPVYEVPLVPQDRLLVASRGLQNLSRSTVERVLSDRRETARSLVSQAKYKFGSEDATVRTFVEDITAVVIDVEEK